MSSGQGEGASADLIAAIDAELDERFAPHAGDPLYDEIRRVVRELRVAQVQAPGA